MTVRQREEVTKLILRLQPMEVHHGGSPGADVEFNNLFSYDEIVRVCHPSNDPNMQGSFLCHRRTKPSASLKRNSHIVTATQCIIIAPSGNREYVRSGGWNAFRLGRRLGRLVCVIFPDGTVCEYS